MTDKKDTTEIIVRHVDPALKRAVKGMANDKDMTMNTLILEALKEKMQKNHFEYRLIMPNASKGYWYWFRPDKKKYSQPFISITEACKTLTLDNDDGKIIVWEDSIKILEGDQP